MQYNVSPTSLFVRPARASAGIPGYFSHGDLAQGVPYTPVQSDFLNDLIDEFRNAIASAGLSFSASDQTQLLQAIRYVLHKPTISGGTATISEQDTVGTGGLLTLAGSVNQPAINIDNVGGILRFYAGSNYGLSYNPTSMALTAPALNATGVVTLTSPASNLSTADGQSMLHLASPGGGDVAIALESAGKYGLKLGLNFQGNFSVGGWSDGANSYRMILDPTGTATLRGNLVTAGINVIGDTITLGSPVGSPTGAGQVIWNPAGNFIALAAGTALLTYDSGGGLFTQTSTGAKRVIIADSSAREIKSDIAPYDEALATIKALPVHTYRYTDDATGTTHIGHMHDEVAQHVPQAADMVQDTPSILLHKLVPVLWRGVQQLVGWLNAVEGKVGKIEKRLKALEAAARP